MNQKMIEVTGCYAARAQIKKVGGEWDPVRKCWRLTQEQCDQLDEMMTDWDQPSRGKEKRAAAKAWFGRTAPKFTDDSADVGDLYDAVGFPKS